MDGCLRIAYGSLELATAQAGVERLTRGLEAICGT